MGRLAGHLATIPMWVGPTLEQDSFDIEPPEGQRQMPPEPKTVAELLASFDQNVAAARAAIARASDEQFMKPWSLLTGGRTIFTQPRFAGLRGMVLNHSVHTGPNSACT